MTIKITMMSKSTNTGIINFRETSSTIIFNIELKRMLIRKRQISDHKG
jgi:hypothetical protein